MKTSITKWTLLCLLAALMAPALVAQPVRNGVDVIWARDVEGATLTLDGALDEAEWASADSLQLLYGESAGGPGSGWRIDGTFTLADPSDPSDGMIYVLRDGNDLWISARVADKSVGGGLGLFNFDGLIISMVNRMTRPTEPYTDPNYFNAANNAEFFYTFWNPADTSDAATTYDDGSLVGSGLPLPGNEARLFGDFGVGFGEGNVERSPENVAKWDARTVVDGISNDDTHGDDVGYTMEMRIALDSLGYDFSAATGDRVPLSIALNDDDYSWPEDANLSMLTRTWWQNQWGNDFPNGVAYIMGSPDVTVNSGDAPSLTEPDFRVLNDESAEITLDGQLSEDVWGQLDTLITLQYQASSSMLDALPGAGAYYTHWFRPDINGDERQAIVIDPSIGHFKTFFQGNMLFIGLDAEDQAISGISRGDDGGDGTRIILRDRAGTDGSPLPFLQFEITIDSTGNIAYAEDAAILRAADSTAFQAAVYLKDASTVADPTDIDTGYQMEIAIDLTKALNYEDGLGDGLLYMGAVFFDGDYLESMTDSYSTRIWWLTERGFGPAATGLMDPTFRVDTEREAGELPQSIALRGNFPNPFNPTTTLSYALPTAGDVTISVYDVLGREVRTLAPGLQAPGSQTFTFDAAGLASGLYIYRIQVVDAALGVDQISGVGKMLLLK